MDTYFQPYAEWALVPIEKSKNQAQEESNQAVPVEEVEHERNANANAANEQ